MKKKLLSLVAMALVAIGMQAQTWTAPVAPDSPFEKTEFVADGTTLYYLYNVGCGQFVTGANSWSTQTSLTADGKPGLELVIEPINEEEEPDYAGSFKVRLNPNKGQSVNGASGTRSFTGTYLFRDSEEHGFIDRNAQGSWYWLLTKAESGHYYWQSHPLQGFNNDGTQYAAGKEAGAPVVYNATAEDSNIEWQFVAVEGYDPNTADALAAAFKVYDAQKTLYELAVAIEEEGLEVDYAQYTNVYNGSDLEALEAAYAALFRAYMEAKVAVLGEGASPSNPVDFTSLLVNPDFSTGNIKGWVCTFKNGTNATNIGYQYSAGTSNITLPDGSTDLGYISESGDAFLSKFIEAWSESAARYNKNLGFSAIGDAELQQTVQYLPAGKYSFTVDCIAVQQWQTNQNPVTGVQLFATGGEIDKYIEIHTGDGKPEHYELTFASTGGDLVMGLRTRNTTANWIAADNFTLQYMGPVDPWQITLETYLEEIDENEAYADIDAIKANAEVKEAMEEALSTARDVVTEDEADFQTAYKTLLASVEALNASIADYKRLDILVKKAQSDAEAYADVEGLGNTLKTLAEQYEAAYEDGTVTKEKIDEWMNNYDKFLAAEVRDALPVATEEKPLRINPLALNLDYAENNDTLGWVVKVGNVSSGGAYKVNNHNGEVWQNSYSALQTIANLPAGKYVVKARAFYRTSSNANGYDAYKAGEDNVTMYLVANENKAKVKNHAEGAFEQSEAPEGSVGYVETEAAVTDEETGEITTPGSGIWLPNSQAAAEWAFNNTEFYQNEVSTYLVSEGDLTFGTRNDDVTDPDNQWNLWTNFEIYYYGKSQNALFEQVQVLAEQAGQMQNDPSLIAITAGEEKLNNALNAADAAKEKDSEETLTAIINDLIAAMDYVNEGQALASKLVDVFNVYDEKAATAEFVSNDETFIALMDMDSDLSNAIASESFESNEQIQGWIDTLPVAWIAYVMGQDEVATASSEAPADVTDILFNPDFNGGNANYWTVDAMGQNNGYQNNSTYTNDSDEENPLPEEDVVTLDQFIECWRSGAILTDGAISQTLGAALPEGTYMLQAEGHAVAQMGYPEGGIVGVNLTVTDGTNTWATPMGVPENVSGASPARYQVAFTSNGKTPVTVGIFVKETNANWIAADNFKLFFLGSDGSAVESIATEANGNKSFAIYNLAGQRVAKAVKGLYIINGKKVVVK